MFESFHIESQENKKISRETLIEELKKDSSEGSPSRELLGTYIEQEQSAIAGAETTPENTREQGRAITLFEIDLARIYIEIGSPDFLDAAWESLNGSEFEDGLRRAAATSFADLVPEIDILLDKIQEHRG
ncbi:MAG: hypothetical protein WCQ32_02735 [bacterium]